MGRLRRRNVVHLIGHATATFAQSSLVDTGNGLSQASVRRFCLPVAGGRMDLA